MKNHLYNINLNLLGMREPEIYGHTTLSDLKDMCEQRAKTGNSSISSSRTQSPIIDWIHEAIESSDGIIINPAAFTHTSLAILDALKNFADRLWKFIFRTPISVRNSDIILM